jgi:hypothetical protein
VKNRRAWVGLQGFECVGCAVDKTDFSMLVSGASGFIQNTGKTPALKMVVRTGLKNQKRGAPIPDWESFERESKSPPIVFSPNMPIDMKTSILETMEIIDRDAVQVEALSPNAVRTFGFPGGKFGRERFAHIEDQIVVYIVGKITYFDTKVDREHHTKFCLVNSVGDGFRFCSTGNDMD